MQTVLLLTRDQMGDGDRELGRRLLGAMLRKVSHHIPQLSAIAFYNGGVKLLSPGSEFLGDFTHLQEQGVDLLPCGTCLDHFGITPAVGEASDMDTILAEVARAAKTVTI